MRTSRLNRLFACTLLAIFAYWLVHTFGDQKTRQHPEKGTFIARVDQQYLYLSDLRSIDLSSIHPEDRTSFINEYVEEWACKQLLMAQGNYQSIQPAIDDKVNDYKNDLLAYHFLENLIQLELNPYVSSEEIVDYYHKYKHNDFILHHDIVRGIFLALPKKATCINAVKSLMLSNKATDLKKLKKCCKPYAHKAILDANKWFPWETVLARLGYRPLVHTTRLLKTNKFIHVAGQKHIYLLKINQYKIAQEIAPLEEVEDQIKSIILHKRRLELINKIKRKLLEDAKKNHTCVIQIK
ncbi:MULTISPECIES: hypothetical protein [unclassified Candidatus Cardinium]|uniref:hypothetical protein n=1 Tax=unclassified Candidatus Cardinium TaxID=2641185 RepID=UPI001FB527CB|nr:MULTISPECIES: hypothetical protein [unclassified Candidatus Cardinium]